MTAEEMKELLLQHPLLSAYAILTFAASVGCFLVWLIRGDSEYRARTIRPTPWQIQSVDFGLFIVCLVLWFVFSGVVFMQLHGLIMGKESAPGAVASLLAGLVMQAGMLYIFLRFRFHFQIPTEGSLSPRVMASGHAAAKGLFYFFAMLPIVYGVSVAWNGILELLRRRGWELELPLQDAVQLFRETSNPALMAGFFLLAVVVAPVVEEMVFRGGIYRFLKGRISGWLALLASATVFGLVHGNLQSLPGLITVGICLGLVYEQSGNIRVPIFFHAFFNLNSLIWLTLVPDLPA